MKQFDHSCDEERYVCMYVEETTGSMEVTLV